MSLKPLLLRFRPIIGTSVESQMIKLNKELQTYRMETLNKRNQKAVSITGLGDLKLEFGYDYKGEHYMDMYYSHEISENLPAGKEIAAKYKKGNQYTFTEKQWNMRTKVSGFELKDDFHFFLLGLDISKLSKIQLKTAVVEELSKVRSDGFFKEKSANREKASLRKWGK